MEGDDEIAVDQPKKKPKKAKKALSSRLAKSASRQGDPRRGSSTMPVVGAKTLLIVAAARVLSRAPLLLGRSLARAYKYAASPATTSRAQAYETHRETRLVRAHPRARWRSTLRARPEQGLTVGYENAFPVHATSGPWTGGRRALGDADDAAITAFTLSMHFRRRASKLPTQAQRKSRSVVVDVNEPQRVIRRTYMGFRHQHYWRRYGAARLSRCITCSLARRFPGHLRASSRRPRLEGAEPGAGSSVVPKTLADESGSSPSPAIRVERNGGNSASGSGARRWSG